jgi:hypothetical protein
LSICSHLAVIEFNLNHELAKDTKKRAILRRYSRNIFLKGPVPFDPLSPSILLSPSTLNTCDAIDAVDDPPAARMKGIGMSKPKKISDIEEFIALPDSEKERILRGIESETPQKRRSRSRPLNAEERRRWRRFKAKIGRPKIGKGAKTISLTVEKDLLAQADAYAKRHGVSRAKLVAQALQVVIGSAV